MKRAGAGFGLVLAFVGCNDIGLAGLQGELTR